MNNNEIIDTVVDSIEGAYHVNASFFDLWKSLTVSRAWKENANGRPKSNLPAGTLKGINASQKLQNLNSIWDPVKDKPCYSNSKN